MGGVGPGGPTTATRARQRRDAATPVALGTAASRLPAPRAAHRHLDRLAARHPGARRRGLGRSARPRPRADEDHPGARRARPPPQSSPCPALLLLRLAAGLRKRKRREWIGAVVITVVMTAAHLFRAEQRPVEASITLVLLVALLAARSRFTAKPDPRSRWFAARVFVQFTAVAIAFGLLLLYAYPHHVPDDPSFWQRLREVVAVARRRRRHDPAARRALRRTSSTARCSPSACVTVARRSCCSCCARPSRSRSCRTRTSARLRALLDKHGERDSLGLLRAAPGQVRGVVAVRARPRSPTGSCTGSRSPAATRSATRRRGPARSPRTARWSSSTAGRRR